MVGESNLDIYDILRKNNGTVNKLKFPVTLKLPPNNHKSILSNRGPSYLFINLDGLAVEMSQFPETISQGDRQSDTTAASTITPSTSSLNFDSQPSTSTEYENNNAVAEIISSLPKWSINDPNVSIGNGPAANGPPLENAPPPVHSLPPESAPPPVNSLPPANALPPVILPGSGGSISANEHSSTSPTTRPPSINATAPKPSTSGTTPPMTNGQPPNRSAAPPVEETLPSGWEIRFDTYGRYVIYYFLLLFFGLIFYNFTCYNLNRKYYVDHNSKSTTWQRPLPLPANWEMRKDNKGRIYYVDHNTR